MCSFQILVPGILLGNIYAFRVKIQNISIFGTSRLRVSRRVGCSLTMQLHLGITARAFKSGLPGLNDFRCAYKRSALTWHTTTDLAFQMALIIVCLFLLDSISSLLLCEKLWKMLKWLNKNGETNLYCLLIVKRICHQ